MDDSAPGVSIPSRDPVPRRTARPLPARIPNTWDNTGRQGGGWEKSPIYKRAVRRLRGCAPQKQLFHFPFDLREGRIEHPASWIDNNFALWIQQAEPEADGLTDPPLNAIADHGFSDGARQRESDLWTQAIRPARVESGEQWAGIPGTLIIYSSEISGSQNSDTFWKTCDCHYLSELTVSFLRPRARRRASTARPSAVSMRDRNPCVLARLRLFG